MARYSYERHIKICNDDDGSEITVGPDRDGLGLFEIRSLDPGCKDGGNACVNSASICLKREEASLLAQALNELLSRED